MENYLFLVSVLCLVIANILTVYALGRIRRDFVTTLSAITRDLATEWNKVSATISILTQGIDPEEKPLTGDLSAPKSEDPDESGMSESKRALYRRAGGNQQ
jgi:hypothetical protein